MTRSGFESLCLVGCLAFLAACANENIAGKPAGSETSDEVAARILDTAGAPLADAYVRIRPFWYTLDSTGFPDHYDPDAIVDTRTDSTGRLWAKLPPGTYRIEVRGPHQGIVIPLTMGGLRPALPDQRAKQLGNVAGRIILPKGVRHAWIRVFGQDYTVPSDDSGNFFLPSVPTGDSSMLISAVTTGYSTELGEGAVRVVPRASVFAGTLQLLTVDQENYTTWRKVVRLVGLLSPVAKSTAGTTAPATALIRLNASNFSFASASRDGRDLRFALPDGTHLPYAPLFYDSAAREAHIVVRLPRLGIGDTAPTIQVFSGRDEVPSRADSAAVWSGISDSLQAAARRFLVDDFSPATVRAKLPSDIDIGPWYLGMTGKASLVQPAASANFVDAIHPADSGRSGNAFHLVYSSSDTSSASYVVVGTNLAPHSQNFRAMDSIVFFVRGNSRFWFAMEDSIAVAKKAWIKLNAGPSWVRCRVRPSDFLPAGTSGNVGWAAARGSIKRISFIVSGGSDFWVTDIRLYGLGADEMR